MRVSYDKVIEDSINLPDMVGVNTPDGVKMMQCEEIEDSDYHVARYQSMVSDRCQLTVDVYKDIDEDDEVSFEVCAKLKYGEAAGEIIYHEADDPGCILEILGNAFAEAEKEIPKYITDKTSVEKDSKKVNINLNINNLDEVKKRLTDILDIL